MPDLFVCDIPGASASTVAWHASIHFGLAGIVVIAGALFLALGIRAYRMPVPAIDSPDARPSGPRRLDPSVSRTR